MNSICIKCNETNILNAIYLKVNSLKIDNLICRKHSFRQFDNIIIHFYNENISVLYNKISKILAEIIIKYYEPLLVKRFLNLNYFYFSSSDKDVILEEFDLLKEKNIYDYKFVYDSIFKSVNNFLCTNKSMILSGFVNFRLYDYKKYLEDVLSESVNQYVIDKEYLTFVNLLKNYINSKVPNNITVNLLYVNSSGILLSEDGNYIKLDDFSSSYLSDITFSQNDYVLNTLVGILPQEIKIHLITPKDQFIKTLEMIFTDKIVFCNGCELCKAYKLLHLE